ncbi:MAG TPA: TIGR00730 family Rossman fold protein [Spirochaetota bacterium]|nr:TIGR00730 family Rossman fold protein [Spirochaetota bacterium]
MKEKKIICVCCSSSESIPEDYFKASEELSALLVGEGFDLVYGGGNLGLMGSVARTFKKHNAKIIGVMPQLIYDNITPFEGPHEIIVTKTMGERKGIMFDKAYGYTVLPGGFGTLEEALEIITLKQLGYIDKPVAFLNTNGFYDSLLDLFEVIYKEKFAKESDRNLYFFSDSPQKIVDYTIGYKSNSERPATPK